MKFSCIKENLSSILKILNNINSKNINLPILKNLLISAEDHGIRVVATNLEIALKALVRGKVEEKGEFTVPIKLLSDYILLLDSEKVDFELKNNELKISSNNTETRIKGMSATDFPIVPQINEKNTYKVNIDELKEALSRVIFTVSTNELRPEIGGVLFKFLDKHLIVVGTDSFRLAEKKLNLEEKVEEKEIIIPIRTAEELKRVLEIDNEGADNQTLEIKLGDNQILFKKGNIELISRIIEGVYPNYSQIIPKSFTTETIIPKEQFLKNIKMSGLFSKSGIFDITLTFEKDKLIINSNDVNVGAYSSSVGAETKGNQNKIVLNHKFLLEGLNALSSKNILIKAIDGVSPLMLENIDDKASEDSEKDYFYLLMPIRQ